MLRIEIWGVGDERPDAEKKSLNTCEEQGQGLWSTKSGSDLERSPVKDTDDVRGSWARQYFQGSGLERYSKKLKHVLSVKGLLKHDQMYFTLDSHWLLQPGREGPNFTEVIQASWSLGQDI